MVAIRLTPAPRSRGESRRGRAVRPCQFRWEMTSGPGGCHWGMTPATLMDELNRSQIVTDSRPIRPIAPTLHPAGPIAAPSELVIAGTRRPAATTGAALDVCCRDGPTTPDRASEESGDCHQQPPACWCERRPGTRPGDRDPAAVTPWHPDSADRQARHDVAAARARGVHARATEILRDHADQVWMRWMSGSWASRLGRDHGWVECPVARLTGLAGCPIPQI
jgi:hypothetical protein